MASSVGIACRGTNGIVVDHTRKLSIENRRKLPRSVLIRDHSSSRAGKRRISVAATVTVTATTTKSLRNWMNLEPFRKYQQERKRERGDDTYERLDEWMRDSIVEIVKNLREAPLLMQVHPKKKDNNSGETTALMMEKKAVDDDWPAMKEKWETRETPLPEGVIFVEELATEEAERDSKEGEENTTRVWGLVVQGKGVGCGPVCYLLKTCRVVTGSDPDTVIACTHFCLVRVNSFRETLNSQLKNCWLLQNQ